MLRRATALVLCAALIGSAQPPKDAVPATHPVVVSVNVAKLWKHPALAGVKEARGKVEFGWLVHGLVGFTPADLERVTVFLTKDAGPFVLAETRQPHDAKAVLEGLPRAAGTKSEVKALGGGAFAAPGAEFPLALKVSDRALLLAPQVSDPSSLAKIAAGVPHDAAGPAVSVRVVGEYLAPLAGDSELTKTRTVAFTLDPVGEAKAKAELTLNFASDAEATAAVKPLEGLLKELAGRAAKQQKSIEARPVEQGTPGPLLEWIGTTLKGVKVKADGSSVVAATEFELGDAVARVITAVPDAVLAGGGSNAVGTNNLKQIGLAIHNYHDANGFTPSNSYDKDGKPLLSWRVHILPYIEQDNLYKQFKLDEPWDSVNNKPLADTVVKIYQHPGRPVVNPNETYYRAFIADKNVKAEYRPWLIEGESKGPGFAKFRDGLSNTVLVFEAGEAVVWTKPEDMPYDGLMAVPKLGGPSGVFTALFGDGSVRTFRRQQLGEVNLRRIISIADGQAINIP